MDDSAEARSIKVDDPRAMRALAHPLRVRLLSTLRVGGPHSVGELCAQVDAAPGSVSYHLGVLAEHGFVEEAPELARDGRERWWRARHASTNFDPAALAQSSPESRVAARAMRQNFLQAYFAEATNYVEQEETLPTEWISAATTGDAIAHLTAEQLAACSAELEQVARKWAAAGATPAAGTEPVAIIYHAFRRV